MKNAGHYERPGKNITRRQFSAAALSAGIVTIVSADTSVPATNPSSVPCTFGFGTYGMNGFTTEKAIRTIADIGFDSVMLDCTAGFDADPARMPPARRADIRRLLKDCGLRAPVVIDDQPPDQSDAKNIVQEDHLRSLAQLCHDIAPETPAIIETILGGKAEWKVAKPLFLRRLQSWAKLAQSSDVTIAIKPHSSTSMSRPEQAIELFHELGSPPHLKLCYDYSHYVLTDMTMEQTIEMSLPWTVSVVIKDAVLVKGKRAFKLPGETGKIDYPALLRQFYAGGYRGDVNCEVSSMIWHKPKYDPIATAKQCYKNIAPAFIAAGIARPRKK